MEDDTQRALKMFYELRKDLVKSEETAKLKQLNQLISLLESSFFNKIVVLHKSLDALKKQRNVKPEDLHFDENTGIVRADVREAPLSNSVKTLPLSQSEFTTRVKALVGDRDMLHTQINKTSSNQTIGFSIKSSGSMHSNGIFVEDVIPDGLAERSGIKAHDQIVAIDGIPLDDPDSNREVAIQSLKSSHTRFDLYLAREKFSNHLSPSRDTGHIRNRSELMFSKELDTEWTQYEIIELTSLDGSFGFGIIGGLTCDVMVRTILSGGSADQDGRLCNNDHIMYINERSVRHLSSTQVADILKSSTNKVTLIVARPFDQSDNNVGGGRVQMVETVHLDTRLQMIVSQLYPEDISELNNGNETQDRFSRAYREEAEDYSEFLTVDLVSSESNLGLIIVNIYKEDPNYLGTLDGIFIKEVLAGSVAEKSGIRKYDRLLKINNVAIESSKIQEAIYRMLNSSGSLTLDVQRYVCGPTYEKLITSDLFPSKITSSIDKKHSLEMMRSLKIHSSSESMVSDVEENDQQCFLVPLNIMNQDDVIKKWKIILGETYEIIIAEFLKFSEDGGLGISLEGTVDVDDSGLEVHPHHYIRSIVQNGPAGRCGLLREKDELLEANGVRLYGVNHLDAVNILKNLPMSVRLVGSRIAPNNSEDYCYQNDDLSIEAERLCQDLDDIIALETGSRSMYSIKSKSQDDLDEWPKEGGKINDSTSRSRSLDQVHGLAIWDRQITYVDLEKRSNGLGFSILDYQDPVNPQQSVIVIRSLVPNGAAAKDERIFPGDRLMSVNEIDVSRATMAEAVDALKKTEPGLVRLGIVKALCLDPNNSKQDSQSPDSNLAEQYDNVSSPQLLEDLENETNMEEFYLEPIPEALERKIRIHKLSGQPIGFKLESEGGYSNNENGFRIISISSGSPTEKCGKLSVGDFITKMDDFSVRNIKDDEVTTLLRRITSSSGDIRVSFIPEADYQIFVQSRTLQVNFR